MPEQQRRALLMREWQGLSYKEIGEELDLSQAAVETLLFRARRSLAAGLGDESPKSIGKRLRAGGDVGICARAPEVVALLTGGAKVAATVATVAATSAVAATPAARHAVEQVVVPPTPPAPRRTAPAPPASEARRGVAGRLRQSVRRRGSPRGAACPGRAPGPQACACRDPAARHSSPAPRGGPRGRRPRRRSTSHRSPCRPRPRLRRRPRRPRRRCRRLPPRRRWSLRRSPRRRLRRAAGRPTRPGEERGAGAARGCPGSGRRAGSAEKARAREKRRRLSRRRSCRRTRTATMDSLRRRGGSAACRRRARCPAGCSAGRSAECCAPPGRAVAAARAGEEVRPAARAAAAPGSSCRVAPTRAGRAPPRAVESNGNGHGNGDNADHVKARGHRK